VKQSPTFSEGWENLAYFLKTQDRLAEALTCHEKSVKLQPKNTVAWYNYGLTLSLYGRYDEARRCHEKALAIDPKYSLARFGRAQSLHQADRIAEAVEDYRTFLKREPAHHDARSYMLFALHCLDGISREEVFAEHVTFGKMFDEPKPPARTNAPEPDRRLRVAVLSPDLRSHSCAYFIEPILRNLDREKFELYLYHDHFREDAVSARLKTLAAVWRNFVGQPAPTVEKTIRADAPDILIDLAGHTGMTNRLPLFARRLAPVQITYLGYPDTTGVPAMDYRFTDALADPEGEADRFATEKLVRFAPCAWTYLPPADAPEPVRATGESPDQVTFGCFNTLAKITDGMLVAWGRIMAGVPGSRLLLKGMGLGDEKIGERYRERFARLGLPVDRIDLLDRTADTAAHLALYGKVDIALDTFPYHGTTTTCEALWMGVPVVTRAGDRHMSRVGVSLLTAAQHPEWIASNADEYVRIAVSLARDVNQRTALIGNLRGDLRCSPLLDYAGQTAKFSEALRGCWQSQIANALRL
jgi:predicted O-linked N-acetylglucosamine transferase (SPINDLY family)